MKITFINPDSLQEGMIIQHLCHPYHYEVVNEHMVARWSEDKEIFEKKWVPLLIEDTFKSGEQLLEELNGPIFDSLATGHL